MKLNATGNQARRSTELKHSRELQLLLGIPEFEKLLLDMKRPAGSMGEPEEAASDGEIFHLPVHINFQTLLDDLDHILVVFDASSSFRADWIILLTEFFELLMVKFRLSYNRMLQQGRKEEAQEFRKQLFHEFKRRLAEYEARCGQ